MIKVIGPRVLIKRIEQPALKSSIIEIVEHNPEPSQFGFVLAVGNAPGMEVSVGDIVVLSRYSGASVTVNLKGEEIEAFVHAYSDLLAVVETA